MPRRPAETALSSPPAKGKGGFRYTELGPLVAEKPGEAAVLLRSYLAAQGGNVSAVARDLGTTYRTVSRWINALEQGGHPIRDAKKDEPEPAATS